MPTADAIKATVKTYVDRVAAADVDGVVDLYADDATVEDPVGSPVHRGREAIRAFYASAITVAPMTSELSTVRVAGNVAVFLFTNRIQQGGRTTEIDVADVMTFDERGRITSMLAVWSQDDIRAT